MTDFNRGCDFRSRRIAHDDQSDESHVDFDQFRGGKGTHLNRQIQIRGQCPVEQSARTLNPLRA